MVGGHHRPEGAAVPLRRRRPQPIDRIGPEPSHAHPHANHMAWMGCWVNNVSVTGAGPPLGVVDLAHGGLLKGRIAGFRSIP